jgi:hypothetical protein
MRGAFRCSFDARSIADLPEQRNGRPLSAEGPSSDFHLPALTRNGPQKDKILDRPPDRLVEPRRWNASAVPYQRDMRLETGRAAPQPFPRQCPTQGVAKCRQLPHASATAEYRRLFVAANPESTETVEGDRKRRDPNPLSRTQCRFEIVLSGAFARNHCGERQVQTAFIVRTF